MSERKCHFFDPCEDLIYAREKAESYQKEIDALKARISELTQSDPSWYYATPADAFRMLAEANKRLKAAEEVEEAAKAQNHPCLEFNGIGECKMCSSLRNYMETYGHEKI